MSSTFDSYYRFTRLPPDIGRFGATVEELRLNGGAPDPDPELSPMAEPRAAAVRLALAPLGSDRLRLAPPPEPPFDPHEGPRSRLVLQRSAHAKLSSGVLAELAEAVQASDLPAEARARLSESLRRVTTGLCEHLQASIRLSEGVYARCVAASKG